VAARNRFDEQEKARLDNNKMLKDRFDRMIDLLSKDRNAALIEAKLIEGNLGKGIIAAELRAGNYTKAYDLFNKAIDAGDKTAFERLKATTKQTTGPDRRLKQGERFTEKHKLLKQFQALTFTKNSKPTSQKIIETRFQLLT
jgi:hypothetical protein